jgi:hypothetical protein
MLVAKLDHLQLIVIRGSLAAAAKRTSALWRALRAGLASEAPGSPDDVPDDSGRCVLGASMTFRLHPVSASQ